MVNKVILIGHLCADPEVRATAGGAHVATVRLATNSYVGRDEGGGRHEQTEFHSLVMFGRRAEIAGSYLRKGKLLYADGRLRHRSWEGDDGRRRSVTEVVVDNFQMLGPKADSAEALPTSAPGSAEPAESG